MLREDSNNHLSISQNNSGSKSKYKESGPTHKKSNRNVRFENSESNDAFVAIRDRPNLNQFLERADNDDEILSNTYNKGKA